MADYNPALPPERIAYFWSNVDRSAGSDACWPWMRARLPRGYGVLGCGPNRHYSHRLAFALSVGPVPSGMYVCHRCDNPPCCNPAHMFVGTALENSRDAVAKGRHSGLDTERARGIKLTADDVVRARSDYRSGVPMAELARRYGVRTHNMYKAVRGITWRHVPDPVESPAGVRARTASPQFKMARAKLSPEAVSDMRRRFLQGEAMATLASTYGVTTQTARAAVSGRRWGHIPGAVPNRGA